MTEQNNSTVIRPKSSIAIPVAIVIAGGLMAAAIFFGLQGSSSLAPFTAKVPTPTATAPSINIADVKTENNPFIGSPDAPVVIAEWADYQCPFCKRFDEDAIKQLKREYIDTGKVKLVIKDFAFLGSDSQEAALIARAVWEIDPDKFELWHSAMYGKQDAENSGWGNKVDILTLTKSLGIDSVKVAQLVTSKGVEYQKLIDADKTEAGTLGINGTPGTIIGTDLLSGAVSYANVKQLIEKALQNK